MPGRWGVGGGGRVGVNIITPVSFQVSAWPVGRRRWGRVGVNIITPVSFQVSAWPVGRRRWGEGWC